MRILYHHRTQGEEPESIHIAEIVSALQRLGHEVRLIGPAPMCFSPEQQRVPTVLGRIKALAPRGVFELLQIAYNLAAARRLAQAVDAFQPDLIYERYALFSFAGVRLARKRGIPLILEVNTPYAYVWSRYYKLRFQTVARWMERRILRAADRIITVSKAQKQILVEQGVRQDQISICHNAIDPDYFSAERHPVSNLVDSVTRDRIVIGFVGTMNRWQGMDAFSAVLSEVLSACPKAFFLMVGDGEYLPVLEEYCATHGIADRVLFTRRQPHSAVPGLIARMDITLLLNSNAWGSPMKIFEYMAMGKAIVAPRLDVVTEVVDDGTTGLLIEAGDSSQMTAQVIRLVEDAALRDTLGQAARRYVVAHHTWHQNAVTIERIYDTMQARPLVAARTA